MPFETLRIVPSVDIEKTLSDNAAGISYSNFIRWRDKIPEKRGGSKYFNGSSATYGVVRALHAWQGLSNFKFLAIGSNTGVYVYYYDANTSTWVTKTITPLYKTVNIAPFSGAFYPGGATPPVSPCLWQPVGDAAKIYVRDPGIGANLYDTVVFQTQASIFPIGSIGAKGQNYGSFIPAKGYNITEIVSASEYVIDLTHFHDGNWSYGCVPYFTTTVGSPQVTAWLVGHNYQVGDAVDFNVSTTVGGIPIYGRYIVTESVITQPNGAALTGPPSAGAPYPFGYFKFNAQQVATSTAAGYMNGNNLRLTYYNTKITGAAPMGGTSALTASDYWFDNWGEELIANPVNGPIFTWSVTSGFDNLSMISDAPVQNAGCFVAMPQQMIMAWGSTYTTFQDSLQIRWSDAGNYNDWTPTTNNQAGGFRIPTGSKVVRGIQGPTQQYWWTDIDLYVSQYVGTPFVFGFNKIGSGCGLIAPKAVGQIGPTLYWMSQKQFYSVSSTGGVQPIPCSVWDYVFQNLNESYTDNIRCAPNSQFNEVTWFFPSSASVSGENDSYVTYNVLYNEWDVGKLARSAWVNQSIFGAPLAADTSGYIYQHDATGIYNLGNDNISINAYFETGYFSITNGNDLVFVDWMLPDMKWDTYDGSQTNATIKISFKVTDYPGDTPETYGPFTVTQATEYIEPRFRGRYMQIIVESDDSDSFWRLGSIRYRYASSGRR